MSPNQRREVGDTGIVAACDLSGDLAKGFLHVDGVPIGDGVQGETEGSELLFLSLAKRASDFATLAVMDAPSETVAQFLAIESKRSKRFSPSCRTLPRLMRNGSALSSNTACRAQRFTTHAWSRQ